MAFGRAYFYVGGVLGQPELSPGIRYEHTYVVPGMGILSSLLLPVRLFVILSKQNNGFYLMDCLQGTQ